MMKRALLIIGITIGLIAYSYLSLMVGDFLDPNRTARVGSAIAAGLFVIPIAVLGVFFVFVGMWALGYWIVKGKPISEYWDRDLEEKIEDPEYTKALIEVNKEYPGAG